MELKHRSVLILGLGESGLAMARWCAAQGARVRMADSREQPPMLAVLRAELPDVVVYCGVVSPDVLEDAELLLASPGIAPHDPVFAPLLQAAAARGVAVAGELQLFVWALQDLRAARGYAPRVVAITGTNGKTTVTRLCGAMLARAGWKVAVAGNVSPAMLDVLREALAQSPAEPVAVEGAAAVETADAEGSDASETAEEEAVEGVDLQARAEALAAARAAEAAARANAHLPQAWVLELSSFQLHAVEGFAADAAVVLNVTQDHLDWHGSMDAYAADKARIYGDASARGVQVINRDDARVAAMQRAGRRVRRFGLQPPQQAGDWGVVRDGGVDWLARALPDVEYEAALEQAAARGSRRGRAPSLPGPAPLQLQRLIPAEALQIHGAHNVANALAALALCEAVGAPLAPLLHALRDYRGEPHRMQTVAIIDEVRYIDDSKGTNVGATAAALAGIDRAVVLIAGGDGKGQDFSPLREHAAKLRAAVLIGRDAPAIAAVLQGAARVELAATLPDAVQRAAALAKAGDAVLLSPACASLDMFRNYAHRAEVFVQALRELAESRGVVWSGEGVQHV